MKTQFKHTYVVLGPKHGEHAGRIKTAYYGPNLTGLVTPDGSRVSDNEHKMGSRLLVEMYAEAELPHYWMAWQKHQAACESGGPKPLPFPDSMLPPVVLEWRNTEIREGAPFDAAAFAAKLTKPAEPKPEIEKPKSAEIEKPKATASKDELGGKRG